MKGTLQQYVGRLHRLHDAKRVVRVYDYVDSNVLMLARMYARRLKGYSSIGYRICNTPLMYLEGYGKQLSWRGRMRSHSEDMEKYDAEAKQARSGPYGYSQAET